MPNRSMFSANSLSLGISLLMQKFYFMSVKLCHLWHFLGHPTKEMARSYMFLQHILAIVSKDTILILKLIKFELN